MPTLAQRRKLIAAAALLVLMVGLAIILTERLAPETKRAPSGTLWASLANRPLHRITLPEGAVEAITLPIF